VGVRGAADAFASKANAIAMLGKTRARNKPVNPLVCMAVVCCTADHFVGSKLVNLWSLPMNKFLSVLMVAALASVSFGAMAGSHGGAMKDDKKMEECKKMDPAKADEKMKAECKKMMEAKK
jgi:hypothetical protein